MAELIYPNGEALSLEPKNGKTFSLQELQDAVEGYIEMVSTKDGRNMVINEEGKLKGLEINHEATKLFAPGVDVIVGNAVVCSSEEIE